MRNDYRFGSNPLATLSTLHSQLLFLPSGVKSEKQKFHGYITKRPIYNRIEYILLAFNEGIAYLCFSTKICVICGLITL
ncbi:MAG: hypothetical protein LBE12_02320 [Planctomycetaceae bacterium]|nr:hypothetical protein [Planctomycetaceae bacterium]